MSEQLYVCENAYKCEKKPCKTAISGDHSIPHKSVCCCYDSTCAHDEGIDGSVCVPVESIQTESEHTTSDPDVVLARSYVSSGHSCLCYASLDELLLRLADKVEGKK